MNALLTKPFMNRNTLLFSVVLAALLVGSLFVIAPTTAQDDGEINLTLEPAESELSPGENHVYEVVVEEPDNGILAYNDIVIDIADPSVGNITSYEVNHDDQFDNSEIQDDGATLLLSASSLDEFENPASEYTIANVTVAAIGDDGDETGIEFDTASGAVVTDFDDTEYDIVAFNDALLSVQEPATGELLFNDQELDDGEVTVEDVSTGQASTIAVTYTDGDNETIAGLADADNLDSENVQVAIEDVGGFPGLHTAWVFDDDDVPAGVGIGDDASPIATDALDSDSAEISEAPEINQSLELNDQANDQADIEADGMHAVVENVDSDGIDSAVILTTEMAETGPQPEETDLTIAGLTTGTFDDETVPVELDPDIAAPGEYTAHIVPVEDLSGEYAPGDSVSNDTAENIEAADDATLFGATLEFQDATFDEPADEGDVLEEVINASLIDSVLILAEEEEQTRFVVDIHPTDDEGTLVGDEFIASSEVLVGGNSDVNITTERVPSDGEFNEFPLTGTNEYVAMIHRVDDGADVGNDTTPGEYPVVPNAGPDGFIAGGVTDTATLEFPTVQELTFNDQVLDDGEVTIEGVTSFQNSTIAVTYEDGDNETIAGLADADNLEGENVQVAIEDVGGFPGLHTAWLFDDEDVPAGVGIGDDASPIAGDALDSDSANVTEPAEEPNLSLSFNEQGIEERTVTVENVESDGSEAAVVITYEDGNDTVVAGLTEGEFDNETVEVELDDDDGFPGNHTAHILPADDVSSETADTGIVSGETLDAVIDNEEAFVSVDATGDGLPARDSTGDGLLDDINGDGELSIADVQALFDNLDAPAVQNNAALFNFAGANPERVSVFDVQGLFTELQAQQAE